VFVPSVASVPCAACGEEVADGVRACTACGAQASKPYFYPVSLLKFAFFGATSFGLYLIWWFWSQLRAEAPDESRRFAVFKTVFSGFFFYSIARRAKEEAEQLGIPCWYSPAVLTALLWGAAFASRQFQSDPALLLTSVLFAVPFIPVQRAINRAHAATFSDEPGPWTWWQVGIAIVLGLFWALMIIGLALPAPAGVGDPARQLVSVATSRIG
jgi:hypothetical protein